MIDGVFEPDPERGVRFIAAEAIDADAVRVVQAEIRRRILRAFVRRGRIDTQTRKEMEAWDHGGGFSLDASVRIEADDRLTAAPRRCPLSGNTSEARRQIGFQSPVSRFRPDRLPPLLRRGFRCDLTGTRTEEILR